MSKQLIIDGVTYNVHIIEFNRSFDILDKDAYRTEDGALHRKVIGTYNNASIKVGIEDDFDLYDSLITVLSAPQASHMIQLPGETSSIERYTSSVKDGIIRVTDSGTLCKDLSFNVTCTKPTRTA